MKIISGINHQMTRTIEQKIQTQDPADILNRLRPFILRCLKLNHEINNPLAGILGYTEFLLEEETLSEIQRDCVHQIMSCADRIEKEISRLCQEKIELAGRLDLKQIFPEE